MKKTIIFPLLFASLLCFAQQEKLGTIERNNKGIITSIAFNDTERDKSPRSADVFFKQYLEIKDSDHFKKVPHNSKRPNYVHEHYDQYYNGVKIEGAGYNFHFKNGQMYFANGSYVKVEGLNATPTISVGNAVDYFLKYKGIEKEMVVDTITNLLIKEVGISTGGDITTSVFLVYRIYLESDHPNNNEVGYINAHTGEIVATEPRLTDLTGTFSTRYSGSRQAETSVTTGGYRLYDNSRGATIHTQNMQNSTLISNAVELVDNDNNWTTAEHSANKNDMGLDIHWALQGIYDYLYNTHNINSYDDAGFSINAYFRYGSLTDDRDNARWNGTASYLAFGDGVYTFNALASVDVIAHEFGHGITQYQIGWGGTFDQAAFNEGMSDIWGAILEQRIRPSATWQIGEQVMANGKSYLRNLQNTTDNNAHSKISDTFGSTFYNNAPNEIDQFYIRSGVFSHWFYILANGESGTNDLGNSYSVTGIGLNFAEELVVEAVFNNYLSGTTTYSQIRTAMINAATAIYGSNSCQVKSITDAWYAVGVGAAASPITISGSSQICTTQTYNIPGLPTGATVTWSVTGTYSISGSNAADSVVVQQTSNGYGVLTASINTGCGNITVTKNLEPLSILFTPWGSGSGPCGEGLASVNIPLGNSFSWQVSGDLAINGGGQTLSTTDNSVVISGTNGTITVTTSACGSAVQLDYNYEPYKRDIIVAANPMIGSDPLSASIQNIDFSYTDIKWYIDGVYIYNTWGNPEAFFDTNNPPCGTHILSAKAVLSCGSTVEIGSVQIERYCSGWWRSMVVYPNPASSYLSVEPDAEKLKALSAIEKSAMREYEVSLYDIKGKLLLRKRSNDYKVNLDIHNLKSDNYFLHIKIDGEKEIVKRQVMVRK